MPPRRTRPPRAAAPRRRPRRRRAARRLPKVVVDRSPPQRLEVLAEAPRSHIVCRVCGRIAPVPLETEALLELERLSRQRPENWSVDHISLSLTGACGRCRQGTPPTE